MPARLEPRRVHERGVLRWLTVRWLLVCWLLVCWLLVWLTHRLADSPCVRARLCTVYSKLKFEAGVHRVQRVPATETQGRIHTSTATVAIMPEVDEVTVEIDPKDLDISTARSGGAGGWRAPLRRSACWRIRRTRGTRWRRG